MSDPARPIKENAKRSGVVVWPRERFYFARLEVRALPRRARSDPRKLGYLFEATLPLEIEAIAAAYAVEPDGDVIACGIEKSALSNPELEDAVALIPDGTPESLARSSDFDVASLNVLVGEFEPKSVARLRRIGVAVLSLAAILAAGMFAYGAQRRIERLESRKAQIQAQEALLLDAALGRPRIDVPIPQRRIQLIGELRKLERTRTKEALDQSSAPDAANRLSELLEVWPIERSDEKTKPDSPRLLVESLRIEESGATLRGAASDSAVLSELVDALSRLPAADLEPPKFQTGAEGDVRFEAVWNYRNASEGSK